MKTIPAPRAKLLVIRGERVIAQMGPGTGFPNCSQAEFEGLLGEVIAQGIPFFGLTAGMVPRSGDKLAVLTNFDEMEAARIEREQEQAAEDFVLGLKELVDEGLVSFVD